MSGALYCQPHVAHPNSCCILQRIVLLGMKLQQLEARPNLDRLISGCKITQASLCPARHLYGPDVYYEAVLELDDRYDAQSHGFRLPDSTRLIQPGHQQVFRHRRYDYKQTSLLLTFLLGE
jgi:hypothetical protein